MDYKLLMFDKYNEARPKSFCTLDCENLNSMIYIPSKYFDPRLKFILASLDGLVCLTSVNMKQFAFWNPLTGAYKMLPFNGYHSSNMRRSRDGIIGFYIDSSNDYKLLHILLGGGNGDRARAYIYSQRLDSWRDISINIDLNYKNTSSSYWFKATFSGQTLYFKLTSCRNSNEAIISFDVNTEVFKVIQYPPIYSGIYISSYSGCLVVLNGCIHLCVAYCGGKYDGYEWVLGDLWRLDGDEDGWVKVTAFPRSLSYIRYLRSQNISTTLSGNWFAITEEDNKNNKSFHKVSMEDFATNYWYFNDPTYCRTIYVETLISPHPSE
ncbi:F-box domain-containing protein [Artemisia annua]|uniref:F-box domain-containing protein n=1 Tax=Artemisia annua TaxID=35608 RepID=A0A2U1PHR4_ARTAN|nr:F-box domain-containing protein [Artemisia annua]